MTKLLGLVSLLAALAIAGWLHQAHTRNVQEAELKRQAEAVLALGFAAMAVDVHGETSGSFAGAPLDPANGVRLVRADAAGYCLESGDGGDTYHLAGPRGRPRPGPCG